MDYRIISIGALSRHELWNEQGELRTPHATTTLIRSGDRIIIVDPGLPAQVVGARLKERAGIDPSAVTDVFLTNFRPAHRAGLAAFPKANWLIGENEREFVGRKLVEQFQQSVETEIRKMLESDIALLKRFKPAPDKLAPQVDLFPLPGYTPGNTGLLLTPLNATILIAGDAIATSEHLDAGRVLPRCFDTTQAQESFVEAIEIADVIVPGHDNVVLNPTRRR